MLPTISRPLDQNARPATGNRLLDRLVVVPLWRLYFWVTSTDAIESPDLRSRMIQTVLDRKTAVIVGTLSVAATSLTAASVTGAIWPFLWLAAEVVLVILRLGVLMHSDRAVDGDKEGHIATLTGLGLLWSIAFGAGCCACVMTGNPVLSVMGGINVAGAAGGISSRNAAIPRYGIIAMGLCCMPFGVGATLSGEPSMIIVSLMIPLWAAGMIAILLQNHEVATRAVRAEQTTRQLARTDPLTGLPNRMFLDETLAALCRMVGARNGLQCFSILCLDLDGFKAVNDRHGHGAGDRLLVAVAGRIRHAVRQQDIPCRTGGDEFVVLLPDASATEAAFIGRRIITALGRPFEIDAGTPVTIGTSVGSVTAPEDGCDAKRLLDCGDQALYLAKSGGRGIYREFSALGGERRF